MTNPRTPPPGDRRHARTGLAIMTVAALWTALLTVGFGFAATSLLRDGRTAPGLGYGVLAVLVALFSARTTLELVRRTRSSA